MACPDGTSGAAHACASAVMCENRHGGVAFSQTQAGEVYKEFMRGRNARNRSEETEEMKSTETIVRDRRYQHVQWAGGFYAACRVSGLVLALLLLLGAAACSNMGDFPATSGTNIDLSHNNYRVVRSNVVGTSYGFWLLGFIPITSPSHTSAMSELYDNAGVVEGKAQALVNVTQDHSYLYLILFGIPSLTVRADIIEFTDSPSQSDSQQAPNRRRTVTY